MVDSVVVCDKCKKPIQVGDTFIVVDIARNYVEQDIVYAEIGGRRERTLCESCASDTEVTVDVSRLRHYLPSLEQELASRKEASELMVLPDEEDKPATTSCSRCKRDFVPGDAVIEVSLSKYDFDRPNVDKVYGVTTWCFCSECSASEDLDYKSVPVRETVEGYGKE